MKTRHFIHHLDHPRLEAAIRQAELRTSGEIVVIVHHRPVKDAVAAARAEFVRRRLHQTSRRNAVLLYVAPESQAFAILGDEGVHRECGAAFWSEVAAGMQESFRRGDHTAALLTGIERAGALLAEKFPAIPGDLNELPDRIIEE